MTKLSTVPYAYKPAWADSQVIGGGPRGRTRLRCKVIAYTVYEESRTALASQLTALSCAAIYAYDLMTYSNVSMSYVCCINQ